MGTHATMAVTAKDTHACLERTFDGDHLLWNLDHFIREAVLDSKRDWDLTNLILNKDLIGNGSIEIGKEREHNQDWLLHVNYEDKTIGINWLPEGGNNYIEPETMKELERRGWTIIEEWDCCNI